MLQVSEKARGDSGRQAAQAARDAIEGADAILLDWDGCIAFGDKPLPEAVRFLTRYRDRVAIVSNNSTCLPEDFVRILSQAGAVMPAERVLLAGTEALERAVEIDAARVLVLGASRMKAHGRNLGLKLVKEDAELVVLLRDTRLSYARLEQAANSLARGARLLVANPDLTHPGVHGRICPETGALLAALMACVHPRVVETEVIGKPSLRLFARAVASLRALPQDAVMIGDNPATDLAGAAAFGARGVLIGPAGGLDFDDLMEGPRFRTV